jgi:hypothetical protein
MYPKVGRSWTSQGKWDNGIARTIKRTNLTDPSRSLDKVYDPFDPKLWADCNINNQPILIIDGVGTMKLTGKMQGNSDRFFIVGPWTNTETTLDMWLDSADDSCEDLQIRSRSKHDSGNSCNWANYNNKWSFEDNTVSHEIEIIHPIYQRHMNEASLTIPRKKWISLKSVCRTVKGQNQVLLQSYISLNDNQPRRYDWTKMSETTFSATGNTFVPAYDYDAAKVSGCIGLGDKRADNLNDWFFPTEGNWIMIRSDKARNLLLRLAMVREIAPYTP